MTEYCPQYKIAIVEDDALILSMIRINLTKQGYLANTFTSAEALISQPDQNTFNLFILDISLPGISGINLLKELRQKKITAPVLMLTAQSHLQNKVEALNLGADDYLVKPFAMEELLARIKALLRRSQHTPTGSSNHIITIPPFSINLDTRQCQSNLGETILSEKEIRLLRYFWENAHQTLNRADILEEVWGMNVSPTLRTIDNFILKFRKLFEQNPEKPKHFISIRNIGYRFEKKN